MQMFYEKEICKTGIMVEHPVEDIIERVGCQFYTKVGLFRFNFQARAANVDHRSDSTHVEGHSPANGILVGRYVSPLAQQSYQFFPHQNLMHCPLFFCADVCNSRYNEDRRGEERGNHFVKIKNWGSCVPEVSLVPELRDIFEQS